MVLCSNWLGEMEIAQIRSLVQQWEAEDTHQNHYAAFAKYIADSRVTVTFTFVNGVEDEIVVNFNDCLMKKHSVFVTKWDIPGGWEAYDGNFYEFDFKDYFERFEGLGTIVGVEDIAFIRNQPYVTHVVFRHNTATLRDIIDDVTETYLYEIDNSPPEFGDEDAFPAVVNVKSRVEASDLMNNIVTNGVFQVMVDRANEMLESGMLPPGVQELVERFQQLLPAMYAMFFPPAAEEPPGQAFPPDDDDDDDDEPPGQAYPFHPESPRPEEECAICRLELESDVVGLPHCSHVYHEGCISNWMATGHRMCPMCRSNFGGRRRRRRVGSTTKPAAKKRTTTKRTTTKRTTTKRRSRSRSAAKKRRSRSRSAAKKKRTPRSRSAKGKSKKGMY